MSGLRRARDFLVRSRHSAYAPLVYGVLLLVTLVPAVATFLAAARWSPLVIVLGMVIAVVLAVMVLRAAVVEPFSIAWAIFWMWAYVFLGLAPLYQLAISRFPWKGSFTDGTVVVAQLVILVGVLAALVVCELVVRRRSANAFAAVGRPVRAANGAAAARFVSVLLVVYSVSAVLFILLSGWSLFEGKSSFQLHLIATSGVVGAGSLFFFSTAGAIVIPAAAIVCRRRGLRIPLVLLIVASLLAFVVTNPLVGSRFLTGSFLIAMVAALLIGRPILRLMPAGIGAALITVFPSLDLARGDGTGSSQVALYLPHQSLIGFDFDAFEMLLREVSVGQIPAGFPSPIELAIAPFVRWVPFISDSVQGFQSGSVVAELTDMGFTNVSMPLWGEAHLTGGFLGVLLVFGLLGLVLGLIRTPRGPRGSRPQFIGGAIVDAPVAALLMIVLRGSLYEVLGYLIFALAVGAAVWAFRRGRGAPLADTESGPDARTVAFYLPQYHPIPENDAWWGTGFTEWVNVARARPQFEGHDHPRRAGELGEYDLRDVSVMHAQAALAREYGVDAFCFYLYRFGSTRLLETPVENYLREGPDFPFCLSWANESWTRRWDGKDKESLIAQDYSPEAAVAVFDDFVPYLRDPRYLRVDGALVIVVHRADHLPPGDDYPGVWRRRAEELGLGPIRLIAAETNPGITPGSVGFDAICEFPPVGSNTLAAVKRLPVRGLARGFRGRLMSYPRLVRLFTSRADVDYVRHPGVVPGWDNTARRQEASTVYVGSTPDRYRGWLDHARASERAARGASGLVFVNAWNEWAEGAYLEPDASTGRQYLEATSPSTRAPVQRSEPIPVGRPTVGWLNSLALAAAGSALQQLRRSRRWVRALR